MSLSIISMSTHFNHNSLRVTSLVRLLYIHVDAYIFHQLCHRLRLVA